MNVKALIREEGRTLAFVRLLEKLLAAPCWLLEKLVAAPCWVLEQCWQRRWARCRGQGQLAGGGGVEDSSSRSLSTPAGTDRPGGGMPAGL